MLGGAPSLNCLEMRNETPRIDLSFHIKVLSTTFTMFLPYVDLLESHLGISCRTDHVSFIAKLVRYRLYYNHTPLI